MDFQFNYIEEHNWPALSWLAICNGNTHQITVHHGKDVETRDDWYCEAVWDGEFTDGDFDLTPRVFGSGGRIRPNTVTFVSSSFSSDRLQSIEHAGSTYISNSLSCLCAYARLDVDPWYPYYYEDIDSIVDGLDDYKTTLQSDRGPVKLTYFRNLCWDGRMVSLLNKPGQDCPFEDYRSYRDFLSGTLQHLSSNLQTAQRSVSWDTVSTSSAGYDSLAVSALCKEINNCDVICVPTSRIGTDDSAIDMIRQLDLQPVVLDRDLWRANTYAEVPFIAADACGRDAWIAGAGSMLHHKLLFTGYFGDNAWGLNATPNAHWSSMHAPAGLSLSEYRLRTGFLHCPVPTLGSEFITTTRMVSASEEMSPWRLNNNYDRPVPRRILEEIGVKRKGFAQRKLAVSVHLFRKEEFTRFMTGPSFRDYMQWIRNQSRKLQPDTKAYDISAPKREFIEVPLFRHLFPWALEKSKDAYTTGQ